MIDKMREEFEAALLAAGWSHKALLRRNQPGHPKDGWYRLSDVEAARWAWEASRAAIRVDLPHLFPFYREGVTEALLEHGIKVNQWGSK